MKISVIIPVYNVEKYIERCLQSILGQTFRDFEIVIVNDCTPDGAMDIIRRYEAQDSRITIYENSQNMGLMWTRMVGYTNARGEYFVFCDSDDYLPNAALQTLYDKITTSRADIIVGSHQYFPVVGSSTTRKNTLKFGCDSNAVYKSLLRHELSHSLCGKIFSRTLFDKHKYITYKNHTNAEDAILFYQLIYNIKAVVAIDDVVYNYMQNIESSSNRRLSNAQLKQMITFYNMRNRLLGANDELKKMLVIDNQNLTIRLLVQNYDKHVFIDNYEPRSLHNEFEFANLYRHHSWIVASIYMLIWNSQIIRRLYHYLYH